MPLRLVPRADWYGKSEIRAHRVRLPASWVFFVNTHTESCRDQESCTYVIRNTLRLHMDQSLPDLRYNFVIGEDGNVYEGRGWFTAPHLPMKYVAYHVYSVLIGFIGSYSELDLPETIAQSAADLISEGVEKNFIAKDFQYKSLMNSTFIRR